MLYQSPIFILLLFCTAILFILSPRREVRFYILLLSSLLFYAWSGWVDTAIFIAVVTGSWGSAALAMRFQSKRGFFLKAGIFLMVLHLFFWKYFPWVVTQIQLVWPHFMEGRRPEIALPIGISFFTLQGIAYLVDILRKETELLSFREYLLFKSFFAQLVAGPIVRARELVPQLKALRTPDPVDLTHGLTLFCLGFLKKTMIADRMSLIADPLFLQPAHYRPGALILGVLAYTIQIWADFSGYTDMGLGAARILGIQLPTNFNSPYLSRSLGEFWRRWHISLGRWIRDYLYVPMIHSFSSKNRVRGFIVVFLVMSISGIWHGANWTFLIWGWYHGSLLVGERILRKTNTVRAFKKVIHPWIASLLYGVFTLCAISLGWLLFRSVNIAAFTDYLSCLIHPKSTFYFPIDEKTVLLSLAVMMILQTALYQEMDSLRMPIVDRLKRWVDFPLFSRPLVGFLLGGFAAVVMILGLLTPPLSDVRSFIYFQF